MLAPAPAKIRSAPAATPKDYKYVRITNEINAYDYSALLGYINDPFIVPKQKLFLKIEKACSKLDHPYINIERFKNVKLISYRTSGKDGESIQETISVFNKNKVPYKDFIKEHIIFSIKKDKSDIQEIIFDLGGINCKQPFDIIPYSELKDILDKSLKKRLEQENTTRPKTLAENRSSFAKRKLSARTSLAVFKTPTTKKEQQQIRSGIEKLPKIYTAPRKLPVKRTRSYNIPKETHELDERLKAAKSQKRKVSEFEFNPSKKLTLQFTKPEGTGPTPLKRLKAMSLQGGRKRQNKYYM
jgi:hypothetical protein